MATARESRIESAFDVAPQAMFLGGLDGTVTAVNRAMRTLLGFNDDLNVSRLTVATLLPRTEEVGDLMDCLIESGRFDELDFSLAHNNGSTRILRLTGYLLGNRPDDGFIATVVGVDTAGASDTTASRTAAFERMASAVAHDLNNVLGSLTGYCHVLRDSIAGNGQGLFDLSGVEDANERAIAIVRQLSAVGERQVLTPARLDPAQRVEGREAVLRRLLPRGVDLQITTVRAGCEISVDPAVFDDIVTILATNASASMPDGGWLHIRISAAPNEREVFLDVMDTGASRRAFAIGGSFDPFGTADDSGPYSPLALAALHALVVRSGGRITAESAPGFGTTFRVTFPVIDRAAAVTPERVHSEQAPPPVRGGKVFVVDDDAALRMLTERVLTLQGYEVIEGRSGEEALNILEHLDKPLDLLVTDLMMPGIKGWDVARAVRARFPECGIVYMSGYHDARLRHELDEDSLFLSKPFSPPKLKEIVSEALRARVQRTH